MLRLAPLLLYVVALAAQAQTVQRTTTAAGYTGLGVTPNAHLLGWGRFAATYDNQLPGVVADPRGHNFVASFGLLPNLEVSGRLASNDLDSNCFTEGCGARDLSVAGKVGIGLDTANRFRVAAGATDVGGAVTYFRTFYGVLTYNEGPIELSAGLARRTGNGINGSRSPLDGPFASAALQPHPLVRGHLEYVDGNAWAGVRVFAPAEWLPEGWSLSAGANRRLNHNNLTERAWWTATLSVPLYKVPALPSRGPRVPLAALAPSQLPLPAYEARLPATAPSAPTVPSAKARSVELTSEKQRALADALQQGGLEDISVGRMPDGTVAVRANNGSYSWNALDALGAALGAVARTLAETQAGYRLILTQRGMPLVAVTGQADCLRQWIEQADALCTAGQLSTPGKAPLERLHDGAVWTVSNQHPGWQRLRVGFSPVLVTAVGSEFGALDYSLGANVSAQLPLWSGARLEWSRNIPVHNTSDYEPLGLFGSRRVLSATDRLAVTQAVRVPLERWLWPGNDTQALRWGLGGLSAQATAGRVGTFFDGVHGAVRWEPGEGVHRVTAQAGVFQNNSYDDGRGPLRELRRANPILGSYRYSFLPTRTDVEATAGQFMNNDRGVRIDLRQWFTDVSVGFYYKLTRFNGEPVRHRGGIEVTLPIGPRRNTAVMRHLQVTGTPRFSHSVETTLREEGVNAIRFGHGVLPPVPTLDAAFNSDRAGLAYFEDNIRRIRDAARSPQGQR